VYERENAWLGAWQWRALRGLPPAAKFALQLTGRGPAIARANRSKLAAAKQAATAQRSGIQFWGTDPATVVREPPAPKPNIELRRGDDRTRPPNRAMLMSGGKPVLGR
jgi:hypothetical protein